MADWIPSNDAVFDGWVNNLITYVLARVMTPTPQWPNIPVTRAEELAEVFTAWHAALLRFQGPHTKVDTLAKNNAKKTLITVVRAFVNQYLRFPPVTDEDRAAMGIPNHDLDPTPGSAPEDAPELLARISVARVVAFLFRRASMRRWGKPKGVHGMELVWAILDTPPEEIDELVHSSFATKSPLERTFKESERGKRLYYAARWETGTVKKGKFSEIFSVIIP
jgi:hypothetical protein